MGAGLSFAWTLALGVAGLVLSPVLGLSVMPSSVSHCITAGRPPCSHCSDEKAEATQLQEYQCSPSSEV